MKNVDAFIELCSRVITDNAAGLVDLYLAAEKIRKQAYEQPFENNVHPMLLKVSDLSFDIAKDYRSEQDDKAEWICVTKTIKNYTEGKWEPTCWILSAMYGEYLGEKLTYSYSVVVRRQNGNTIIETASDELRTGFTKIVKKINVEQTDERYLQNFATLISANSGNYRLASIDIKEYLTEPYYLAV